MQKQKENVFLDKFRLLNSQENTEDILWSSSGSSDYENVSHNGRNSIATSKVRTRKRKVKKKKMKNISNLNVTIVDVPKDNKKETSCSKSPILLCKSDLKTIETSPVFAPSPTFFPPLKCAKIEPTSPILSCKVIEQNTKPKMSDKSPILPIKYNSPKASPKVRKKLFKVKEEVQEVEIDQSNNTNNLKESEEVTYLNRKKTEDVSVQKNMNKQPPSFQAIYESLTKLLTKEEKKTELEIKNEVEIKEEVAEIELIDEKNKSELTDLDDTFSMLKTENSDLVQRVKTYFDSHFSSETPSQHSINESLTPNQSSKTSEEIEITSFTTQINSNRASSASEQDLSTSRNPSPVSSQSGEIDLNKPKKTRYKKGGLAYRFSALIKKQNANISLWQHERFLVENSNFVLPKGEHVVFRIQTVEFKYGSYLIEGVDANDVSFWILINSIHAQHMNIAADMILKVYEPYEKFDISDDCNLLLNVCKFECIDLNEES